MKLIKLMVITAAVMLCTAQAFAYSFVNANLTANVAADGVVSDLYSTSVGPAGDLVQTMYATISYRIVPGDPLISKRISADYAGAMWTHEYADLTPGDMYMVESLYRVNKIGANEGTLDIKVSTKLEDSSLYLAQRYDVEYDQNGGGALLDVNLQLTMVSSAATPSLWAGMDATMSPYTSDWGAASPWPTPTVDTARLNDWRVQGYVPGIPDGKHVIPPNTITMDWNLGSVGPHKALEIRTDANVVPEPCTMALMGAGLLGLFGARRRKRA
ncbi:MAG: PEP-CTERM sorting domain-containing protein [Candidatus Omnitrophica bacterium]|nr:PEP-CTERM sorting domain-containing protein [Candidatus Omnitrophota bacterium]